MFTNLLITQIKGSNIIGELIISIAKKLFKLLEFNKAEKNKAPKNVLPPSPIKIFAGLQFHKRNPNNDVLTNRYLKSTRIANETKITHKPRKFRQ